jgi:hypothetical protein
VETSADTGAKCGNWLKRSTTNPKQIDCLGHVCLAQAEGLDVTDSATPHEAAQYVAALD